MGYEISSSDLEIMDFRGRTENDENLRGTIGYLGTVRYDESDYQGDIHFWSIVTIIHYVQHPVI